MKKQLIAITSVITLGGMVMFTSCAQEDTTAPTITIAGGNSVTQALPATAGAGTWTNPTATAQDDEDGDLSSSISVSGTVDPNTKGQYTLTYTVSDAAGNSASETVTVNIVNNAEYLAGSYTNAYDTCQSGVASTFDASISADAGINNKIAITNFGAFGNTITIIGNVSGSSISFPGSQTLGGSASLVTASGTITNTTAGNWTCAYTWTDGSSTEVCTTLYNHD